jgi:hypothetical protein
MLVNNIKPSGDYIMKGIKSILYASLVVMYSVLQGQGESWTWFHRKIFTPEEISENAQKKEVAFCKNDCDLFTQLVFSWNALRDEHGYFSFWVQARNEKNGKWSDWHKMVEWGNGVQRSFLSKGKDNFHYAHVRLESGDSDYADAFRLKLVSHDGADLSLIKSFAVALSNYRKFHPEVLEKNGLRLSSVRIKSVPKIAQLAIDHDRANHMCSPTSCSMLVSYLAQESIDALAFAHKAFDGGLDTYGSWPFNTAHAFELGGCKTWFAPTRLHSFYELHQLLKQSIPVVVSVRGALEGAPRPYEKGHLLVVIGWDRAKQMVICHDPAFDDASKVLMRYPIESFLKAWERSYRLAYVAEPIEKK